HRPPHSLHSFPTRRSSDLRKFTEAINESLAYANAHPDEVRDVLKTYTDIDQVILDAMTLPLWPVGINRESVETLARLGQADGIRSEEHTSELQSREKLVCR